LIHYAKRRQVEPGLDKTVIDDEHKLTEHVKKIFFEQQLAVRIFDEIFTDKLPDELKNELHQQRFTFRQNQMKTVRMFPHAAEVIRKLSQKYNLVIISATDEDIIKDYLARPELNTNSRPLYDCFKYVFGKREHDFNWQNIDRKSQLIHKITSIIGVPVERMVYVGDNNGDFVASRRINIDFIEARLFEREVKISIGKESLIFENSDYLDDLSKLPFFSSWKDFCNVLSKVEQKKQKDRQKNYGF
jgi:phosphoglycolate phosphatase-like HAD superfamily hydrolase